MVNSEFSSHKLVLSMSTKKFKWLAVGVEHGIEIEHGVVKADAVDKADAEGKADVVDTIGVSAS